MLVKVIKKINITGGFALGQTTVSLLAYSDHVAIIGNNMAEIKSVCRKLIKTAEKVGLIIKDNKTVYIILNRKEFNFKQNEIIKVENHSFKSISL